jgi:hypothetical protein
MKVLRWTIRVVVYGALTVGLWNMTCWLVDSAATGLSGLVADFATIEQQQRRDVEQTTLLEAIRSRIEARRQLVRDVMEGRLALREAAAQARALHRRWPSLSLERVRECYPGCSDEEAYCRLIMDGVEVELGSKDARAEAILERVEAELEEMLRYQGLARLPGDS